MYDRCIPAAASAEGTGASAFMRLAATAAAAAALASGEGPGNGPDGADGAEPGCAQGCASSGLADVVSFWCSPEVSPDQGGAARAVRTRGSPPPRAGLLDLFSLFSGRSSSASMSLRLLPLGGPDFCL